MKLLSYKAFTKNSTFFDKVIGVFTFGAHSHSELQFSDGTCFSISARDKVGRFKKININPHNWDNVEIDISEDKEKEIRKQCDEYLGIKYDYVGALFSVTAMCIQNKDKIFCSEVCSIILLNNGILSKKSCGYNPSKLHKTLKKKLER